MQRNLSHSMFEYVQAARNMLYLVKAVDLTNESLYSGPALERALWRYEALWLPLIVAVTVDPSYKCSHTSFGCKVDDIRAKNFARGGLHLNSDHLVPPLDIAWVWHCHRLNPVSYARDIASLFTSASAADGAPSGGASLGGASGTPPPLLQTDIYTSFRFSNGEDSQSRSIRRLWAVVYPFESYMPRYLLSCTYEQEELRKRQSITSYANELGRAGFRTILSYDISKNALLQRTFLYQVIDENDPKAEEMYESNWYLNRAFDRYLLFLALHKSVQVSGGSSGDGTQSGMLLVPMKDINIMWQAHLSCTKEYITDCRMLVGYTIPHDSIAVERLRLRRLEEELVAARQAGEELNEELMEDSEMAELQNKQTRGVSIKETKHLWEHHYGTSSKYDLPGTYYRGQPPNADPELNDGDSDVDVRGGFKAIFEKQNGSRVDLPLSETIGRMFGAIVIVIFGVLVSIWSFYKTMISHANYLLGIPAGGAVVVLGLYCFLIIPISRPLSSEARFWQDRSMKQTHNPLPPYLVSTTRLLD